MRTFSDGRPVYYMGDTHSIKATMRRIAEDRITNSIIVHCGDVGIGFNAKHNNNLHDIGILDDYLLDTGNTLICCRSNHDNPKYWNDDKIQSYFADVIFAKDNEIINIGASNHLFLNGAISIDRKIRTENLDYWKDEVFVLNEEILSNIKDNIDIVVSHTSPNYCYPIGCNSPIVNYFAKNDKELIKDLIDERELITKAANIIKNKGVKQWVYDHFHPDHTEIEVIDNIEYTCLPIGEIRIL